MSSVTLDGVTKQFGRDVVAVDGVSMEVTDGEILTLVGPSGSGKSTLLRLIAGLEAPSAGRIRIGDRDVTDLAPGERDVAMVFQSAAVFPHLSVADNLGFGLRLRGQRRALVRTEVSEVAELLGLDHLLGRRPHELSGGERQRVAIGRALLRRPAVFLMDEPLSSLDAPVRLHLRNELARLHRRIGTTIVYVTHDQSEAMTLGDRVAVLHDGALEQADTPAGIYHRPRNRFVAGFIGSPPINLVDAVLDHGRLRFHGHALPAPEQPLTLRDGDSVTIGIRPADLHDASGAVESSRAVLEVTVDAVEHLGSDLHVSFSFASASGWGSPIHTARLEPGAPARVGARLRLSFDPALVYLFDPSTGLALRTPGPPATER